MKNANFKMFRNKCEVHKLICYEKLKEKTKIKQSIKNMKISKRN